MTQETAIVVFCACSSLEEANAIADKLLADRLCACVNILDGMVSKYHWKGRIESSQEALLIIKSRKDLFERLKETVVNIHSYDVPEIISLEIASGLNTYLEWIYAETI